MPETKGIKIKFEADASPVKSALSQVEKASRTLTKQLKDIDKLLELDPSNITLLAQKQDILQKAVANTTTQLKGMENAQNEITKGYTKWQENQKAIEQNNATISKLTEQLSSAQEEMQNMWAAVGEGAASTEQYEAAAHKVAELTNRIDELRQQQKALAKDPSGINEETYQRYITDTERLRVNLQQLGEQQNQVNAQIADGGRSAQAAAEAEEAAARAAEEEARAEEERKRAIEQAKAAEEAAEKAARDYKSALDKLKKSANDVKNDIKEMATAVGAGITAVGGAVVAGTTAVTKVGMEFSTAMSNVEALSGAAGEELQALSDAAADAGANTSKSASQAADALGYMALAGWDSAEMLGGLMPVLRASEAGAMDLANCSDLVTDSMSAMGIAVDDLQHYLDVVTKTQSSSNTSMQQLLEAYKVCGGMLKTLNVPLEESAALLGTLANRGIKGAEAGTALNSILVNLVGANKNAASAMKDMGASAFDSEGRFIGLENTLSLVKEKLDEYGDDTERITQLEAKLGGKTQLDTLQALLSGVSEEYSDLNAEITECNGALEETAKTMQDNLQGDITSLTSALEGVENTIFSSLEEPFRDAAQGITDELRKVNEACGDGELADSVKKIAIAIAELMKKAAAFAGDTAFPTLIKWLEWLADNADAVISAIEGMGAAWGIWKIAQYAKDLQALVEAIRLVEKASVAAELTQNGLAASADAAAVSEEALAAATEMTAAAFLALEVAIGAVLIALALFIQKKIEAAREELQHRNDLDETTIALREQAEAYEAAADAARENCAEADKNADASNRLWREIQSLVNEDGKAIGKTEELQRKIEELNTVSGLNIEVIDGQIQGYQNLVGTMDDYIERMRTEAKLSAMKETYTEAVVNWDEATKQYEDTHNKRLAAVEEYEKKRAELNALDENATYEEIRDTENAMYAAANKINSLMLQEDALKREISSYEGVMKEYENIKFGEDTTSGYAKGAAAGAKGKVAEQLEGKAASDREAAGEYVEAAQKTWDEVEREVKDLDNRHKIGEISDDDYWEQRKKLLEENRHEEEDGWYKYYGQVNDYYTKLSEEEEKAAKQEADRKQKEQDKADKEAKDKLKKSIDDQIDEVKLRQQTDNKYTEEMMYNDMETIISGLDKESDLYKKYNAEIIKGRKKLSDSVLKETTDGYKKEISTIEGNIKKLTSEYQSAMKQLLSQRDAYFNKLFDTSKLTSTSKQKDKNGNEADVFSLADPEEEYKKLVKYEKAMDKLSERGMSDNVKAWIEGMDTETAQNTIDVLSHMTDAQLKNYSKNFDKLQNKAGKMADSKYAPAIKQLQDDFIANVDAELAKLPGYAEAAGENTVQGYINGLGSKVGDLAEAASSFVDSFIGTIKDKLDIHSPSKETEELGEYTAKGFMNGLTEEDMGDAADTFVSDFLTKLAAKDPAIHDAMESAFAGNLADVMSDMESIAADSLNRIASSVTASLPDITKLSLPSVDVMTSVGDSGISTKLDKLDKLDTVIDLFGQLNTIVQSISVISQSGQRIQLQLELNGELTADMDRLTAILRKRLNDISIQTGKAVISY